MTGFVHILRIATAIALIALLAPTTRAVDNAGSAETPRHIQNHLDLQLEMIPPPQPEAHRLSQLFNFATPKLNPMSSAGLMKLEERYKGEYGSRDQDYLQDQFSKLIYSPDVPQERIEQAVGKKLVELSVELIVLGRLLVIKRDKSLTLGREDFGQSIWRLVNFLEIMTPSRGVPATGEGKKKKKKGEFVGYLERNLSAFEETMFAAFQQRARGYHVWANKMGRDVEEAMDTHINVLMRDAHYLHGWNWGDTDYVHQSLYLVHLWVDKALHASTDGRLSKDVEAKVKKVGDLIDTMISSIPDGRRRSVKKYLEEEREWLKDRRLTYRSSSSSA